MNKAKRDGSGIPVRIYRPEPASVTRRWIIYIFMVAIYCGIPIYLQRIVERYPSMLFSDYSSYYAVIIVTLIFFAYLGYRRHYLAIYENGIMLSSPLKQVFSSWDNLKALSGSTLLTKEAVDERVKKGQNEISLSRYAKALAPQGQLLEDLQHFTPHLFE